MLEKVLDAALGGVLPYASVERRVHVVDGTTYAVGVTWFRRGFLFEYDTPHLPRKIRKAREAETRRVAALVADYLASQAPLANHQEGTDHP